MKNKKHPITSCNVTMNSDGTTEIYTQVATNHLKWIKSKIELLNLQ